MLCASNPRMHTCRWPHVNAKVQPPTQASSTPSHQLSSIQPTKPSTQPACLGVRVSMRPALVAAEPRPVAGGPSPSTRCSQRAPMHDAAPNWHVFRVHAVRAQEQQGPADRPARAAGSLQNPSREAQSTMERASTAKLQQQHQRALRLASVMCNAGCSSLLQVETGTPCQEPLPKQTTYSLTQQTTYSLTQHLLGEVGCRCAAQVQVRLIRRRSAKQTGELQAHLILPVAQSRGSSVPAAARAWVASSRLSQSSVQAPATAFLHGQRKLRLHPVRSIAIDTQLCSQATGLTDKHHPALLTARSCCHCSVKQASARQHSRRPDTKPRHIYRQTRNPQQGTPCTGTDCAR